MQALKTFFSLTTMLLFYAVAQTTEAATPLDQKKVHVAYEDGDFDAVTKSLESFLASNKNHSRQDSLFIAKHLAVVYSANPKTREKGKYYMYRLLEMLPSAKLVDMYVSDEIDRIFEKVREEFTYRQKNFGVDSTQMLIPEKAPATASNQPPAEKKTRTLQTENKPVTSQAASQSNKKTNWTPYWIAAGATGAVAVGVTAYLMSSGSSQPEDQVLVIPDK